MFSHPCASSALSLSNSRTGIIYNVTKAAVGVIVNKKVGNRFVEKRVNIRIEHIKHSKCRDDFLRRVKENAAAKLKAKADGVKVNLKRQPALPRLSRHVSTKYNTPATLNPIPYDSKSICPFIEATLVLQDDGNVYVFMKIMAKHELLCVLDNSPSVNVDGIDLRCAEVMQIKGCRAIPESIYKMTETLWVTEELAMVVEMHRCEGLIMHIEADINYSVVHY